MVATRVREKLSANLRIRTVHKHSRSGVSHSYVSSQSSDSEEHNGVDRTKWRKLLRPFSHVKTLWIEDWLVEEVPDSERVP